MVYLRHAHGYAPKQPLLSSTCSAPGLCILFHAGVLPQRLHAAAVAAPAAYPHAALCAVNGRGQAAAVCSQLDRPEPPAVAQRCGSCEPFQAAKEVRRGLPCHACSVSKGSCSA